MDDYDAAGVTFARWRETRDDHDKRSIEIWAYCYVQRYFTIRFLRERTTSPSDIDLVISRAFERILTNLETVRDPLKFAGFVSVICKRALLNHRGRRKDTVEAEDHVIVPTRADEADAYDGALARRVIVAALAHLPDSTRQIAQWRLLEEKEYEWISEQTGRPIATVRTYVSKALTILRSDDRLRALHFDDLLPPQPEAPS